MGDAGGVAEWFRHGPAKPVTAVRFRSPPPTSCPWSRAVHRAVARSARVTAIPRPSRALLDRDDLGDGGGHSCRRRDLIAVLPHDLEVVDDRLTHQRFHLGDAAAGGDTPRQLRRVGGERIAVSFDDDRVARHRGLLSPAWRKMFASVPGLTSLPRLPATVGVPGFTGCRKAR